MAPVFFDNNEGAVTGNHGRGAPSQPAVVLSVLFTPWKWPSLNRRGGAYGPSCWAGWFGSFFGGFFFPSKSLRGAASCEAVSPGGDTVVPNRVQLLGTAGLIPCPPGDCLDSDIAGKNLDSWPWVEHAWEDDIDFQILFSNFSCHGNKIPFLLHAVTFPQHCTLISNRLCLSSLHSFSQWYSWLRHQG